MLLYNRVIMNPYRDKKEDKINKGQFIGQIDTALKFGIEIVRLLSKNA